MKLRERPHLQQNEYYPIGLGCQSCDDRVFCGGIRVPGLFSCRELCCGDETNCDFVCPKDLSEYVTQVNEIRDYDLNTIDRVSPVAVPQLPLYIPLVYHKSANRIKHLNSDFVAISLMQLVDFRSAQARFRSHNDICQKFGFRTGTKIVVTGVADDLPLQKYWYSRNPQLLRQLRRLDLQLITTPNFSTIVNAPRWTDMCYLKRTFICWKELTEVGVPTSLHLNGRTAFDWQRMTEWILERNEVGSVAFEFATVDESLKLLYAERLVQLARSVPRRLQLVLRGGMNFLARLSYEYDLVFIDSDPFMSASRRSAENFPEDSSLTPQDLEIIDDLLEYNISTRRKLIYDKSRPLGLNP